MGKLNNSAILTIIAATFILFISTTVLAQSRYPSGLLNQKGNFTRGAANAIGQPFRGVATSDGIIEGLFAIKGTSVSSRPVREAADRFLATLNTSELSRSHFAINDPEWRDWSNVDVGIFSRRGISLEEMSGDQKSAAWALLEEALSAEGVEQARSIMRTEQRLLELNSAP